MVVEQQDREQLGVTAPKGTLWVSFLHWREVLVLRGEITSLGRVLSLQR